MSVPKSAHKSAKKRHRRINIIRAIKALSSAAMVVAPVIMSTAAALATELTDRAAQIPLDRPAVQNAVYSYFNILALNNDGAWTVTNMTDYLTNMPNFYSDTPTVYRFVACGASDIAGGFNNYLNVVNLAGAELFSNSNFDWVQDEKSHMGYGGGIYYPSPALGGRSYIPPGFVLNNSVPIELCTAQTGIPPFFYPNATAPASGLSVGAVTIIGTSNVSLDDPNSEFSPANSGGGIVRTGNLSQPLTVQLQLGGDAVLGTDYTLSYDPTNGSNPDGTINITSGVPTVTIPANFYAITLVINWFTKTENQPEKAVIITPILPAGYQPGFQMELITRTLPINIANVTFSPASSTTLNGGQTGQFTVTRNGGDLSAPLVVNYSTGGSATNGEDYGFLDGSIEIPAGQSSATVSFPILNRGGSAPIPEEQIVITPVDPSNSYNLASPNPLTYTLPAYTPSQISVTPGNDGTATRGQTTNFTVGRDPNGDLSQPLTVNYSLGGGATNGEDYTTTTPGTTGSVTIPAGQSSANVPITVPREQGTMMQPAEDIVLTVEPGNGYALQDPAPTSTLMIPAYDPAAIQIMPTPDGFSITRPATGADEPLTFNYTLGGTATPGTDYSVPGGTTGSITIPAGQTTATLPVDIKPNPAGVDEPEETITLTPAPGNGYDAASIPPASITIPGTMTPTLTSGTGSNPPSITVTRPQGSDPSQPISVPYQITGGTATPGSDFGLPNAGTITIPAGQMTGSVALDITPDATPGETVGVTLIPPPGFKIDNPNVTYTIAPSDIPSQADIPLTVAPGDGGFTVTRPNGSDIGQPVTVPYEITGGTATPGSDFGVPTTGTVTIPAGSTTGNLPLGISDTATPGETVTVKLTPPDGYTMDNPNATYTIKPSDVDGRDVPLTARPTPDGVTVSRPADSDLSQPVTIPYDVSNGDGNISPLPGSVTIPAGQSSAQIPINPLPGANPGETVTLNLKPPAGYTINDPTVDYMVPQGDVPQVGLGNGGDNGMGNGNGNGSIPGNPNASVQDGNLGFTVVRTPGSDPNKPLDITYDVGGTAIPGEDYVPLPGKVTIPGGKNKVRVPIRLLKDPSELEGKTIRIRLLDGTTYNLMPGRAQGDISFNKALIDALSGRGNGMGNGDGMNGNGNGDGNGMNGDGDGVDVTIDDGSDDDDDGGGGGGAAVIAPIAGLGVVGGTIAATGAFGGGGTALADNACPFDFDLPAQVEQLAKQVDDGGTIDWDRISFSVLPQVNQRPAAQVFTLGQFGSALGDLSLKEIAAITGQDMSTMTLSSLLSLNPSARVSDIPGLAEYLSAGASNKQTAPVAATAPVSGEMMLSTLLSQRPAARNVMLSDINGAMEMELRSIANWEQIQIGQVPGLAEAPFNELFPCLGQDSEIIPLYDGPANGNPVPPPRERQ